MQANKLVAQGRLSLAEDMLAASGWKENGSGWNPPSHMADILKRDLCMEEVGGYHLPDAVAMQLKFDAAVQSLAAQVNKLNAEKEGLCESLRDFREVS